MAETGIELATDEIRSNTDVGAIRDVIDHGATGLLVPVGDTEAMATAVSALLTDAATRAAMGAAAAERCSERFTIARTAPFWLDLLSSLKHPNT